MPSSSRQCQMGRIEIGDADGLDETFIAQLLHLVHGVEPARIFKAPPVELQQINRIDAEAVKAFLYGRRGRFPASWGRVRGTIW